MKPLLIISLLLFSFTPHPIHISVTNIDYDIENNKFDISVKLFIDDFETILNKNNIVVNLGKSTENKKADLYIKNYISEKLQFQFNNKKANKEKLKFIKKEIKMHENVIWLYFEYQQKKVKSVKIKNTLFNDLYYDQKNLLIFTCKETEKAIKFTHKKTEEQFTIN